MRRLIGYEDLKECGVPYHKAHVQRLVKQGRFPRPVRLNGGQRGRALFVAEEVDAFVSGVIAARDS